MSEEDFEEIDKLIDEKDALGAVKISDEIKKLGKLGSQATGIHATDDMGALDAGKPITVKDVDINLMDGIMPQSNTINNFINKQMSKTLGDLSRNLNIKQSKKGLLSEQNEDDFDILIDNDIFKSDEEN